MADELKDALATTEDQPFDDAPATTEDQPATTEDQLSDDTLPAVPSTQPLPSISEAPRALVTTVDAPRLHDVRIILAGWMRALPGRASNYLAEHRLVALSVAVACAIVALVGVAWGIDAAQMPPDDLVTADARQQLTAPSHVASNYEADDPLVVASVDIERKQASDTRNDARDVTVGVTFANASMESHAEGQMTYVRDGDTWTCIATSMGKASHHALAGVDQRQVLAHIDDLFQVADTDESGESLSGLYRNATFEVVDEQFDEAAQTDQLTIHCLTQGTFASYECDLNALFRFAPASGAWELAEATASEGAKDLGFGPLVGTWHGIFTSQDSLGGKCLAARSAGLTVEVTSAAMLPDGDARIEGRVTGVAHCHPEPESDADDSEQDLMLEAAPFSGHISTGEVDLDVISLLAGNDPKQDAAGIVFDCAVQDLAEGTVELTLTFGQADAPDAASAALATSHSYESTLLGLFPYQRDARYVDHFTLEKTG